MRNSSEMKFGLIGYPIGHSLSPGLFKAAYHGQYCYELIENQSFDKSYALFIDSYKGINITAPFKELALAHSDCQSEECQLVGAANILIKKEGKIWAYNSDCQAVKQILKELHSEEPDKSKSPILVIGCGGAGKAAVTAAILSGVETIIVNRDTNKAEQWAERFSAFKPKIKPLTEVENCTKRASIIINTLPCELESLTHIIKNQHFSQSKEQKTIIEANYRNPHLGKLIKHNHLNINYISGQKWLLEQAKSGYFELTEAEPDYEAMCQYLSEFNLA